MGTFTIVSVYDAVVYGNAGSGSGARCAAILSSNVAVERSRCRKDDLQLLVQNVTLAAHVYAHPANLKFRNFLSQITFVQLLFAENSIRILR